MKEESKELMVYTYIWLKSKPIGSVFKVKSIVFDYIMERKNDNRYKYYPHLMLEKNISKFKIKAIRIISIYLGKLRFEGFIGKEEMFTNSKYIKTYINTKKLQITVSRLINDKIDYFEHRKLYFKTNIVYKNIFSNRGNNLMFRDLKGMIDGSTYSFKGKRPNFLHLKFISSKEVDDNFRKLWSECDEV